MNQLVKHTSLFELNIAQGVNGRERKIRSVQETFIGLSDSGNLKGGHKRNYSAVKAT